MDNNKIGKFIANLRQQKNLTQKELGEKLFVTDKAVSKWERGLSLPDISLLTKMAEIFDIDVVDILNGEKGINEKIDVEDKLNGLTKELKLIQKKKIRKLIFITIILIIIIVYLIFINISWGYNIKSVHYEHTNKDISLGIPKYSFLSKNNDRSYSFKNLRNSNILENEVKNYLKTLDHSICNDSIYYYNKKDKISIIEYSVENNFLYSTISYEVFAYDYCFMKKLDEYTSKMGNLLGIHSLNSPVKDKDKNKFIEILFLNDVDHDTFEFSADLMVHYYEKNSKNEYVITVLEDSKGSYEIKDTKLYYYRTKINESDESIAIPEVSVFEIKNYNLVLIDNYLSNYEKNIILK